jgi:hypothetical protein
MKGRYIALTLVSLHGASSWLPSSLSSTRRPGSLPLLASSSEESSSTPELSRRQWLTGIASVAVTAGCLPLLPENSNAADLVSSASVCDPTVSVLKKDGRMVYLLGTAHISSSSAQLAGNLVKDVHPKGVFVELDPKRVKGSGILAQKLEGDLDGPTSRVIVPNIQSVSSTTSPALLAVADSSRAVEAAAAAPAAVVSKPNPLMRAASVAVGNSIKGMYKKLDTAGFNAGEEFVVSIREGQSMGADIILGDRDVEVTLRRLTEGLAQTDLKALLNPDSELEQSLKELVPTQMDTNMNSGDLSDEQTREEFSSFVEVMKTKDNVRKIMGQLQRVAPALYEALVSERDAYMAAGLNGLDELETIVAVMGIAHVDGVEQNLILNGWKPALPTCAGVKQ